MSYLKNTINIDKGVIIIIALSFILIVITIPIVLTRTWGPECLEFTESTGWVGDTLGGITAPFIGFLNIILLIWTLQKQIEYLKSLGVEREDILSIIKENLSCYD